VPFPKEKPASPFLKKRGRMPQTTPPDTVVDIDTLEDWKRAELIFKSMQEDGKK